MSTFIKSHTYLLLGATLALALAWPAQAREIKSLDEMRAVVRESMPAFLKEPGEVVGQLLRSTGSATRAPPRS